jgi:ketosteroid isomerase-like protein
VSQNVDRMMEGLRAMERGDLDAIVAMADPEVEFINPEHALEPGTRHGHDGLRVGLGAMLEVFENLKFELERVVENGDHVVALGSFRARGRGSGMEVVATFAVLATLRDGKMVRYEWFTEAAEALRAAGIPPDAGG